MRGFDESDRQMQKNMTRLKALQATAAVRAILPDQGITANTVRCFTPELLKLMHKTRTALQENE
jgi:hypothetical protein